MNDYWEMMREARGRRYRLPTVGEAQGGDGGGYDQPPGGPPGMEDGGMMDEGPGFQEPQTPGDENPPQMPPPGYEPPPGEQDPRHPGPGLPPPAPPPGQPPGMPPPGQGGKPWEYEHDEPTAGPMMDPGMMQQMMWEARLAARQRSMGRGGAMRGIAGGRGAPGIGGM